MPPRKPKSPSARLTITAISEGSLTVSTSGTMGSQGARIASWILKWGDGSQQSGSGTPPETLSRVFRAEGEYRLLLLVQDSRGGTAEAVVAGKIIFSNSLSQGISGDLALNATFDCMSVARSLVSGAAATLQYKPSSSSTWLDADTPIYDSRATVGGSTNPYQNQYRASIVGLTAGTSYDVRMTIGGAVYQSSVSTLASSVTNGGTTRTVTPVNIAAALAVAVPGDIIDMTDGTYSAFTMSTSGTATAWISFVGRNRDACFIAAGDPADLTISANYIQLKNIRFKKPTFSAANGVACVGISANAHHVWMDNIYCDDIPLPTNGTNAFNTCISVGSGCHNIYLLNSTLLCPSLAGKSDGDISVGGFGFNTSTQGSSGTFIVKGNTITGKFQDAIGSAESVLGNQWINSDIANNTITDFSDDAIQVEGDAINCRVWGNVVTDTHGNSCFAQSEGFVGPTYAFRNLFIHTVAGGSYICKTQGDQFLRFYHNTIDNQGTSIDTLASGGINGDVGIDCRNNIFYSSASNIIYQWGPGGSGSEVNRFDYNLLYRADAGNIVRSWNGNGAVNYTTVAAFFAAQGQEQHGISGSNPNLQGASRTILNTSPAYRVGVTIPNFNDANSAWPASLAGSPCMGYFEAS